MDTQQIKLFIIDDNPQLVVDLRKYLESNFGESLTIFTYNSSESALKSIDHETDIVILDCDLPGADGNEILKSIKKQSKNTENIFSLTWTSIIINELQKLEIMRNFLYILALLILICWSIGYIGYSAG